MSIILQQKVKDPQNSDSWLTTWYLERTQEADIFHLHGVLADANSISDANIADNSINASKLVNASITTTKINDGAVTESKIGQEVVTENKIAASAVTNIKIANNAISSEKIATNAISSDKIAEGGVTKEKLDSDIFGYVPSVESPVLIFNIIPVKEISQGEER